MSALARSIVDALPLKVTQSAEAAYKERLSSVFTSVRQRNYCFGVARSKLTRPVIAIDRELLERFWRSTLFTFSVHIESVLRADPHGNGLTVLLGRLKGHSSNSLDTAFGQTIR
jgi:hypothetical protein